MTYKADLSTETLAGFCRQPEAKELTNKELFAAAKAAGFKDATMKLIRAYRWRDRNGVHKTLRPEHPRAESPAPESPTVNSITTLTLTPRVHTADPGEVEWKRLILRIGIDRAQTILDAVKNLV
jgi:hypothetical protein